ncbi:hypothetical protein IJT17_02675 [bacterium]|nr:hypothetical protein [bacterium]
MPALSSLNAMGWSGIVLALLPVVAVMFLVRFIEGRKNMSGYEKLQPAAKAWLCLQGLSAATAAKALLQCDPALLRAYLDAGEKLEEVPSAWQDKAISELLSYASIKIAYDDLFRQQYDKCFRADVPALLGHLQKLWPVQTLGEGIDMLPNSEPVLEPVADLRPIAVLNDASEAETQLGNTES